MIIGKRGGHIETSGLFGGIHKFKRCELSCVDLNGVVPNPRLSIKKRGSALGMQKVLTSFFHCLESSVIDTA